MWCSWSKERGQTREGRVRTCLAGGEELMFTAHHTLRPKVVGVRAPRDHNERQVVRVRSRHGIDARKAAHSERDHEHGDALDPCVAVLSKTKERSASPAAGERWWSARNSLTAAYPAFSSLQQLIILKPGILRN